MRLKRTRSARLLIPITMLILIWLVSAGNAYADRFIDNQNGTVTDTATGLIWTQNSNPLAEHGKLDWYEATTIAQKVEIGGHHWRLPTMEEMNHFLPSYFGTHAAEMSRVFSDIPSEGRYYWSSAASNPDNAYLFSFSMVVVEESGHTSISISRSVMTIPKSTKTGTAWLVMNTHPENPVTKSRADFVFNWLESLFPEILYPSPQPTQETGEDFYRYYPEADVSIKTMDRNLYFTDHLGESHDLGSFMYWAGFAKAETIFNWLEVQPSLEELMSPSPQITQVQDDIFYRMYPNTGFIVFTQHGRLKYTTDNYATTHDAGSVDEWLELVD